MNWHVSCPPAGDKVGVTDLDVIGVGMIAVATVKTVLENPRYVCNVSDSKDESFFRVEIAHLLVTSLLSVNIRFWQRREAARVYQSIQFANRVRMDSEGRRTHADA